MKSPGLRGDMPSTTSSPTPVFLPINVIEEIAKPVTLALRLFGNLLSRGTRCSLLIAALGTWTIAHIPVGNVVALAVTPSGSSSTCSSA